MSVTSIRLEPIENAPVYYVNYVEIGNSPQDFSLLCARLPAKLTPAKIEEVKKERALIVEPDVQVVIPTALVPGLIRALTAQKESYEEMYGVEIKEVKIKDDVGSTA